MKTTCTGQFEKGFLAGLAGVGKRRTRKQMLHDMTEEAFKAVDMAKGLQGRGDWHGAATKLISSAGLIDQAIDLAETLPGVRFDKTREQTSLIIKRLGEAQVGLDVEPDACRNRVWNCIEALTKAIDAVEMFAGRLLDDPVLKDGEELDFDEDELIKALGAKGQKSE